MCDVADAGLLDRHTGTSRLGLRDDQELWPIDEVFHADDVGWNPWRARRSPSSYRRSVRAAGTHTSRWPADDWPDVWKLAPGTGMA